MGSRSPRSCPRPNKRTHTPERWIMKHSNEHVKTECRQYGVFSACCVVTTEHWRTPRNVYEQRTGGREWESNPPRTGRRPFRGFEVRTPHRGRFSSSPSEINLSDRWAENNKRRRLLASTMQW